MKPLSRRQLIGTGLTAIAAASLPASARAQDKNAPAKKVEKRNVLFIIVDDLWPQLNCYGQGQMITPNLDKLAAQGVLFERGYCAQGVCAPSRISLLAGVRPDTTGITDLETPLSSVRPDLLTLPHLLKNNGYTTVSLGKVYHHRDDDLEAWSRPPSSPKGKDYGRGYLLPENREIAKKTGGGRGPATECVAAPDAAYDNGALALGAITTLRELKDEPFFLAVGFHKPHLPFAAPKQYWDLYQRENIALPANYSRPKDAPDVAFHTWGELRNYTDIPDKGELTDEKARELIHGYYAGVSYTDAQIGLVIDELDRLGLGDETLVVFCVAHGWSLGENSLWCKHSNFENTVHTPLILRAPNAQKAGSRARGLVEWIDIYPSICDLCGVEKPAHLEGQSFVALLTDGARTFKAAAYSQYPRRVREGYVMGYTMRTDRYRFTDWGQWGRELYDHETDAGETSNLAIQPQYQALIEKLSTQMQTDLGVVPGKLAPIAAAKVKAGEG